MVLYMVCKERGNLQAQITELFSFFFFLYLELTLSQQD